MRYFWIVLCLLAGSHTSYGLVNIEKSRWHADHDGMSLILDLGARVKSGNTELADYSTESIVGYRSGKHLLFLLGGIEYGTRSGEEYENQGTIHLRYNLLLSSRFTLEAFTQLQYDDFRLLTRRFLAGGGIRFTLWNSNPGGWTASGQQDPSWNLVVGMSAFDEEEKYNPDSALDEISTSFLRLSSYLVAQVEWANGTSVSLIGYAQPRASDWQDLRAIAEGEVSVRLWQPLSLVVVGSWSYDSEPVDPTIEQSDLSIRNSLRIEF